MSAGPSRTSIQKQPASSVQLGQGHEEEKEQAAAADEEEEEAAAAAEEDEEGAAAAAYPFAASMSSSSLPKSSGYGPIDVRCFFAALPLDDAAAAGAGELPG